MDSLELEENSVGFTDDSKIVPIMEYFGKVIYKLLLCWK
jgi:hypothetical protein